MAGLQDVWGLGGYLQRRGQIQDEEQQNLQQATGLMGLMQAAQKQKQQEAALQRQAQAEGVLRALPPDAKPEEVVRALRPFAGVDTALRTASETENRNATIRAAEIGRSEGREQRMFEIKQRGEQELRAIQVRAAEGRITKEEADARAADLRREMFGAMQALKQPRAEPAVTPVTIQAPDDPASTIIIDGRTGRVLGKGPKMTEAGKIDAKTNLTMTGLGSDLQSAEDLLTGVTRTSDGQVVKGNKPTGSGIGAAYDAAAGFFGATPAGAAEADSLKVVAARLTQRIPRFEGPQSDKDLALYKQAAGDVGNEKLPIPRRLAAAKTMRSLYAGYESGQRGRLIGNRRAGDQGSGAAPKVVDFNSLPE